MVLLSYASKTEEPSPRPTTLSLKKDTIAKSQLLFYSNKYMRGVDIVAAWQYVLLALIGVLYAWPVRGTFTGHSVGAMLPGAIIGMATGMFFALGASAVTLLAAAGALGTYAGGKLTYDETAALSYGTNPPENFRRGMAGLAIKGGVWFGYAGAVLGIASGLDKYNHLPLLAAMVLGLPVMNHLGIRLLNEPVNPAKAIFPRFYFSKTKKERWGGLFFMILYLCIFMVACKDYGGLIPVLGGVIGGALGFPFAHTMQYLFKYHARFIKVNNALTIPTWKIMEMLFGAAGGAGIAVSMLFRQPCITVGGSGGTYLTSIWLGIFAVWEGVRTLALRIKPSQDQLDEWNANGLLMPNQYRIESQTAARNKAPAIVGFVRRFDRRISAALYCYLPLLLVLSGSILAAKLISCSMILYIVTFRAINRLSPVRNFCFNANDVPVPAVRISRLPYRMLIIYGVSSMILSLSADLVFGGYSIIAIWLMYTAGHLVYMLPFGWLYGKQTNNERTRRESRSMNIIYTAASIAILLLAVL